MRLIPEGDVEEPGRVRLLDDDGGPRRKKSSTGADAPRRAKLWGITDKPR
jgi:hypothetical protein